MRSLYFLLLLCILGCNTNDNKTAASPTHKPEISLKTEDFEVFNKRFHTDTVFQMERIKFPLEGGHADGFERGEWTKDNWEYLEIPIPATGLPKRL